MGAEYYSRFPDSDLNVGGSFDFNESAPVTEGTLSLGTAPAFLLLVSRQFKYIKRWDFVLFTLVTNN